MPAQQPDSHKAKIIAYELPHPIKEVNKLELIAKRISDYSKTETMIFHPYRSDWKAVNGDIQEQEEAKWNAVKLIPVLFQKSQDSSNLSQLPDSLKLLSVNLPYPPKPWTKADTTICVRTTELLKEKKLSIKQCTNMLAMNLYIDRHIPEGRREMELVEVKSNDDNRCFLYQKKGACTQGELQDIADIYQGATTRFVLHRVDYDGNKQKITNTSEIPKHRADDRLVKDEIEKDTGIRPDEIVWYHPNIRKRERIRLPASEVDKGKVTQEEAEQAFKQARAKQKQSPRRTGRER